MTRPLAYLLTALLLLQSFGRELLVLHFAASQAARTAKHCVNKTSPRLRCNGKCYLARQLRRAENSPAKAPAGALAKVSFEVVRPARFCLAPPAWAGQRATRRYTAPVASPGAAAHRRDIFHPPTAWA